jgi:coenzyme F420-dependent glucose-6-phosphate dehydrogenase
VSLGPAVSAIVHRYNPVVMAQQAATLELMNPGRAFLGVGSGEAMNEVPAGLDWPSPAGQLARTEEALTIITRMLRGETVSYQGRYFRAEGARLYDLPERRVPVYMSAFGPRAAANGRPRWPTSPTPRTSLIPPRSARSARACRIASTR